LLLPATIPILLINPIGTRWGARSGAWLPTAVGMALLAAAGLFLLDLTGAYWELVAPFLLLGVGIGLQITPCAEVAVGDAADAGEGVASGIFKAASMIGGSLGVAASTAVFQTAVGEQLRSLLASLSPEELVVERFLAVITGSVSVESLSDIVGIEPQKIVVQAFDAAVARAMWPSIVFAVLGVVVAVVLMRERRAARKETAVAATEQASGS